jgi:hypothetical protein
MLDFDDEFKLTLSPLLRALGARTYVQARPLLG